MIVSNELPGLYVASRDLKEAFMDVAPSIEALIFLDFGVKCEVTPEVPFDDFAARVKGVEPEHDDFVPAATRRFSVLGACA